MAIRHTCSMRKITPKMARSIRASCPFELQRTLLGAHVNFLRETMEQDEFDSGSQVRFAKIGKQQEILIDANHRLEAISGMPDDYEVAMPVTVSHCDTAEEVANLYARIDRGRGRSLVDALKALGIFDASTGLTPPQGKTVLACAPLFEVDLKVQRVGGSDYASKSAENRRRVMAPWMDAAAEFYKTVGEGNFGNSKYFLNRQIAVVGIATFADAPARERAKEFWGEIARDNGLKATDPRKVCLEFIRSQYRTGSITKRGSGTMSTVGYMAHAVAACWNAFYRNEKHYSRLLVRDPKAPLRLLGTRYRQRRGDDDAVQEVDDAVPNARPMPIQGELPVAPASMFTFSGRGRG